MDKEKEAKLLFRDYLLDEILEADGERKKTLSDVLDCFDHSSISRGLDTHKDD